MKHHYTFGDSDAAADRLTLLARAFEPSSSRLLRTLAPRAPRRALDLGCGPGHTTALVQQTLGAPETWGFDSSERMVALAGSRFCKISFAIQDVTAVPFPVADVDAFYARYLLTHLAAPREVLHACAKAAGKGARFVIEENCSLQSADPTFVEYYGALARMHAHYGQDMHVGQNLARIAAGTRWRVERFEQTPIPVEAAVMARLHAMNVRTWRSDPFAASTFRAAHIDTMTHDLDDVAAGRRRAPEVTCVMGQIILALA
ncbi:MAG: class I SAM-dependent methyltransferase [Polyangiaceae bacterium]|jgi:ubiquinone/menaquinone biosynthesis C-methylase UbiE